MILEVDEEGHVEATANAIERMLATFHKKKDYVMNVPLTLLRQAETTKRTFNIVLGAIAGISLLVGGIGIMNIMLVSVTERIKEIGLRMAIGATPANILWQFILEAVLLSTVGGIIGVGVGVGAAKMIGEIQNWPIVIEVTSAIYSFLFSAFVGMFFGFYPAYRASKLNPIDCLRYE
jgi:putative ABC transport system permease protein